MTEHTLFAIKQVIIVLHGHKLMPAMLLRNILQSLELPSCHTTRTNIPNLPTLHNIIKSPHDLLSRSITIQSVDLKNIDMRA